MKEKIGIEKLIELLNEYDGKNHWWDYDEEYLTSEEFYEENGDLEIISKKFGFIKWLVENDKIECPTSCAIDKNNDYTEREIKSDYESLLMLLSIQDEPIRFLYEILK